MAYINELITRWNASYVFNTIKVACTRTIYSDASASGYGGVDTTSQCFIQGRWSDSEIECALRNTSISSTHLEMICLAVRTLCTPNDVVQVFCDSLPAVTTFTKRYSKSSELCQSLLISLDRWCFESNVKIKIDQLNRENEIIAMADSLSKNKVDRCQHCYRDIGHGRVTRKMDKAHGSGSRRLTLLVGDKFLFISLIAWTGRNNGIY